MLCNFFYHPVIRYMSAVRVFIEKSLVLMCVSSYTRLIRRFSLESFFVLIFFYRSVDPLATRPRAVIAALLFRIFENAQLKEHFTSRLQRPIISWP